MILKNISNNVIKIPDVLHNGLNNPNENDGKILPGQEIDCSIFYSKEELYRSNDFRDAVMERKLVFVFNGVPLSPEKTIEAWNMQPLYWAVMTNKANLRRFLKEQDSLLDYGNSGAQVDIDFSEGPFHMVTLDQDSVMSFSNADLIGRQYMIAVFQDNVGGRNLTFDQGVIDARNNPVLFNSGAPNEKLILTVIWTGNTYIIERNTAYF